LASETKLTAIRRPRIPVNHGFEVMPHVEWQPTKVAYAKPPPKPMAPKTS
jgi:hypothetical protein